MDNNPSVTATVARGASWLSVSTVLLKFIGIGTMVLVLSNLSVYEYGAVELALSVLPLMSIFMLPGLSTVVIADMGIEKSRGEMGKVKGLYLSFFKTNVLFALVAWAVLFFGSNIIAQFYNEHIGFLFKIVSISLLVSPIRAAYQTFFAVNLQFREQALVGIFEEICKLILVAVLVAYFKLGIIGMLFAVTLSQVGSAILVFPRFFSSYKKTLAPHKKQAVSILSLIRAHAKWGILATYTGSFGQSARLFVIKGVLGTEAVGLFALALGLWNHLASLIQLPQVVGPLITQSVHDTHRFITLITKGIKYQFITFCISAVGALLFLPLLISFLFPKYGAALPLFNILLLMLVPMSFDYFFNYAFFALRAQKDLFIASLYKVILTLLFFWIGGTYFGLSGIGYGFVLVSSLYCIERYRRLKKLIPGFVISPKMFFKVDELDMLVVRKLIGTVSSKIPFLRT